MASTTDEAGTQVTRVLGRVADGHRSAVAQLLPLVYEELRRLARSHMRRQSGHTLQATALVHEAYVRLVGQVDVKWEGRAHFFAVAATAMRQILSNHARRKRAAKRGSGRARVTLSEVVDPSSGPDVDLLALHEALEKLAGLDERQSQLVEMRFFGGMTVAEIAQVLGVSTSTVEKEWVVARAWLSAELRRNDGR